MTKTAELKMENIRRIRECFYESAVWTKNELSDITGLSLAAVTNILRHLCSTGEIRYTHDAESTGGRKSKIYELNPDFHHIGAVMLRKNKGRYVMDARVFTLDQTCVYENTVRSRKGSLEEVISLIEEMMAYDKDIHILSVSIPGVCRQGVIDVCDYSRLRRFNFGGYISEHFGIPAVVENDVNAACIGFSKQYPQAEHLALVYQPDTEYSGCGIMIHGKLYNGFSHAAGEVRFLPAYTHQQQDDMLKKEPEKLLADQIISIAAVMNPQIIGWHSDAFSGDPDFSSYEIPKDHRPEFVRIPEIDREIENGLYYIGKNYMLAGREKNGG